MKSLADRIATGAGPWLDNVDWTRLRALRRAAGLTQSQFAPLSQRAISNLEHGRRNDPAISTVVLVAAGLGLDPGTLLAAVGYRFYSPPGPTTGRESEPTK